MKPTAIVHVRLPSGATACETAAHFSDVSLSRAEAILGGYDGSGDRHRVAVPLASLCCACTGALRESTAA